MIFYLYLFAAATVALVMGIMAYVEAKKDIVHEPQKHMGSGLTRVAHVPNGETSLPVEDPTGKHSINPSNLRVLDTLRNQLAEFAITNVGSGQVDFKVYDGLNMNDEVRFYVDSTQRQTQSIEPHVPTTFGNSQYNVKGGYYGDVPFLVYRSQHDILDATTTAGGEDLHIRLLYANDGTWNQKPYTIISTGANTSNFDTLQSGKELYVVYQNAAADITLWYTSDLTAATPTGIVTQTETQVANPDLGLISAAWVNKRLCTVWSENSIVYFKSGTDSSSWNSYTKQALAAEPAAPHCIHLGKYIEGGVEKPFLAACTNEADNTCDIEVYAMTTADAGAGYGTVIQLATGLTDTATQVYMVKSVLIKDADNNMVPIVFWYDDTAGQHRIRFRASKKSKPAVEGDFHAVQDIIDAETGQSFDVTEEDGKVYVMYKQRREFDADASNISYAQLEFVGTTVKVTVSDLHDAIQALGPVGFLRGSASSFGLAYVPQHNSTKSLFLESLPIDKIAHARGYEATYFGGTHNDDHKTVSVKQ